MQREVVKLRKVELGHELMQVKVELTCMRYPVRQEVQLVRLVRHVKQGEVHVTQVLLMATDVVGHCYWQ